MESPTDDEPIELTNGYFYWQGIQTSNLHPPLSRILQALPIRFLAINHQTPDADQNNQLQAINFFFNTNQNEFELMTMLGRWITLIFGLGIGLLLFIQTRVNRVIALAGLMLWAFEPTLLAYSGLCLADIPMTFFFLAAVLAFKSRFSGPNPIRSCGTGILTAMAVGCKLSALALIPIFVLLELSNWKKKNWNKNEIAPSAVDWLWGSFGFIAFICLLYLPGTLWESRHLFPMVYFEESLQNMMGYTHFHHPTYFLGQASRQNHWLYFLLAFALKTTIPLVVLTLASVIYGTYQRSFFAPWLWIPPLILFLSILPVQNLGIRYLLPIFPFLILMTASFLNLLWKWKLFQSVYAGKLLFLGFLLWHVVSVVASAPNMISYFNEFVSKEKRLYYLSDSNLDMGQDIKRVAIAAEAKGWRNIKLAQFGGAIDPSIYGMYWEPWTQKDLIGPQPGHVYLANALLFQLGPIFEPTLLPIAESWMIHTHPTGQIGDTWFYFEIPGKIAPDSTTPLESVHYF